MTTERYTVMTRKGQITVPVEIRKALGLSIGDRVAVSLDEDGQLQAKLRPVRSIADATFGSIMPRSRPEDLRQLRQDAIDAMAENVAMEGRGEHPEQ